MKKVHLTKRLLIGLYGLLDTAVFSLFLSTPLILLFRRKWGSGVLILVMLSVFTAILLIRFRMSALRKERTAQFEAEQRNVEKLLLMSDREIGARFGEQRFYLVRKAHPGSFDLLEAIRSGTEAIGVLSLQHEGRALIRRYAPHIRIIERADLMKTVFGMSYEEKNPRFRFLSGFPVNKYFLLGTIFFCLSFAVRYKIYYRLISCLCLIISPFTGFFRIHGSSNYLRIFLDKDEDR